LPMPHHRIHEALPVLIRHVVFSKELASPVRVVPTVSPFNAQHCLQYLFTRLMTTTLSPRHTAGMGNP
jgi:hypothetical protein